MPDITQSSNLRKMRTSFPPNKREVWTLGLRQRRQDVSDKLDLVFVMDTTGSMGSYLETIADSLAGVAAAIASEFPSVKYSVVSFKDEDETTITTGGNLVSLATAQAALDGLTADGGDDTPENGYGAIYMAVSQLPFRAEATRAIVLVTDTESHERGRSYLSTKNALLSNHCYLFAYNTSPEYNALIEATGGSILVSETVSGITAELANRLKGLADPVADPVWIVNDNANFTAQLETGSTVTFLRRPFAINPFNSGESGGIAINLTIDNTDFAVSKYLAKAKLFPIPIEVTLRVYDHDDTSGPQNNPPLVLFATDFEIRGTVVSCQLKWLDLINAPFPNSYYTPTRCPSMQ